MKSLRKIRIFATLLFFAASLTYVLWGIPSVTSITEKLQILPSFLSISIGITLFWCVTTFFFGRIYCSSVCPIGTLQDIIIRLSRALKLKRSFSYRPARKRRYDIVLMYVISLFIGIGIFPLLLEPWIIFQNIISVWKPQATEAILLHLGIGVTTGLICGIASLIFIVVFALFKGRAWCNEVCPIGIVLGTIATRSQYHIEFDPDKCINCMACEEVCKSECIKVVSRYVDNSRCVRCFNCIASCPNDAIRYQYNRNKLSTPLMKRTDNATH